MQSQNSQLTSSYSLQQTADLRRYYFNYTNEDKDEDESSLRSMLGLMAKISAKYFPPFALEGYYCRTIVWIKIGDENHLICTASMNKDGKIYHAEELITKILYHLYKNNKEVIDHSKIKVHRMYIDVEPCDGERYGKDHQCEKFFSYPGKYIDIEENERIQLRYHPDSIVYFNVPLPPKGVTASCRSDDSMREQCILGIDLNEMYENKKTRSLWDKCYILDYQGLISTTSVKPKEIDLKEFFIAEVSDGDSVKFKKVESFLRNLANIHHIPEISSLSEATHEIVKRLCRENSTLLNKFIKVIAKGWKLNIILTIPGIRLNEIKALREVQAYYEETIKKESQHKTQLNLQQKMEPLRKGEVKIIPKKPAAIAVSSTTNQSMKGKEQETKDQEYESLAKSFQRVIVKAQKETIILFIRKLNNHPYCLDILTHQPPVEFNYLQNILRSCDHEVLVEFFSLLRNQLNALPVNKKKEFYVEMFLSENQDGWNSLHLVLASGHPEKVLTYFLELGTLFQNKLITREEYIHLFNVKNKRGFTPLHEALVSGHHENLSLLIKALQDMVAKRKISELEFANILMTETHEGFTPLHYVFINGDPLSVTVYLNALQELVVKSNDQNIKKCYVQLLKAKTKSEYTALHDLFIHGNDENAHLFFKAIKKGLRDQIITKNDCEILLMSKTKHGFTIVHDALKNSKSKMVAFLLKKLEDATFEDEIITPNQLKALLLDANEEGYTPLLQALRCGSYENLILYLDTVKKLVKKGIISDIEYKKLLLSGTIKKFTPLEEVIVSNDKNKLVYYTNEVKKVVSKEEYIEILLNRNSYGNSTLHTVLGCRYENLLFYLREVNEYLNHDRERFIQVLTECNEAGLSTLQQALSSRNVASLELFYNTLKDIFYDNRPRLIEILLAPNKDGYNPLHSVLLSHPENLRFYLKELKSFYPDELTDEDYRKLFLGETLNQDTTSSFALRKYNEENVKMYFFELTSLYDRKIISKEQFILLLTKENVENMTPLHHAVSSGHVKVVKFYVEFMKKYFPGDVDSVLLSMLNTKNNIGQYPFSNKKTAAAGKINYYLKELKKELEAKVLQQQKQKKLSATHGSIFESKKRKVSSIKKQEKGVVIKKQKTTTSIFTDRAQSTNDKDFSAHKRKLQETSQSNKKDEHHKKQKMTPHQSIFLVPKQEETNTQEKKPATKKKDMLGDIMTSMNDLQKIVKGGSHSL